jgi:hypothetical protein
LLFTAPVFFFFFTLAQQSPSSSRRREKDDASSSSVREKRRRRGRKREESASLAHLRARVLFFAQPLFVCCFVPFSQTLKIQNVKTLNIKKYQKNGLWGKNE